MELEKWERVDIKGTIQINRLEGGDIDVIVSPRKRYRKDVKIKS